MSNEVEIETIIKLNIKGYEIVLTADEAEKLYHQLKNTLKKENDIQYIPYPVEKPYIPNQPIITYLSENTE